MGVVTPTGEDYIKAILMLHQRERVVRIKDIARSLQVKMPTVVSAIKNLVEQGLVVHEPYGYVELTDKGLNLAKNIQERHRIIFNFLHKLIGIDAVKADEQACRLEHYLPDDTIERIRRLGDFISNLPAHYQMGLEKMLTQSNIQPASSESVDVLLSELDDGQSAKIKKLTGDRSLRRRLMDMGFVAGETVKVIRRAPLGDPIEISIKGYKISLRKVEAQAVVVSKISDKNE
ncbi:DtxR family transcriptional regulator [Candidatus Sumerlaeota bacterium]|nr:DtxR family transcriptional regulator [Candidatus Sumerlaeota bacterium]